jgi:hypothetical protein
VYLLDLGINRAMGGPTQKGTLEEEDTLRDAVQIHGGKSWGVVAALLFKTERSISVAAGGVIS